MIKAILASLTDEERRQLMCAFEDERTDYIQLPDGKFIGVNVRNLRTVIILEEANVWAYGEIIC